MQALHLSFGLGAFLSPIVSAPFLTERVHTNLTNAAAAAVLNASDYGGLILDDPNMPIQYSFYIISAFSASAASSFLYLFIFHRHTPPHPSRIVVVGEDGQGPESCQNETVKFIIVCLATLFMHFYVGLEVAMGTLLTSFANKSQLQLPKATSAAMTSLYWGTFTFFRLFAVFYID